MEDVVPKLYEAILSDFRRQVKKDKGIQKILSGKVDDNSQIEMNYISMRLGDYVISSLKKNLTSETLPDGKLYWNIAQRTVKPLMYEVYELTNHLMFFIQEYENERDGIGIKPIRADFPEDVVDGIINKMVNDSLKESEDE